MRVLFSFAVAAAMLACGPDLPRSTSSVGGGSAGPGTTPTASSSGPTAGTFSCDQTVNGKHLSCADYNWSGGAYSTEAWTSACAANSGRSGTGCSRGGSAGGCRTTTTTNGVTITITSWFFGDAYPPGTNLGQAIRTACTTGTVVSP